jgi:hypothetical protein
MLFYASFLLALPGGDVRVTPRVLKVRGRQRRPAGEQRGNLQASYHRHPIEEQCEGGRHIQHATGDRREKWLYEHRITSYRSVVLSQ